ncbi:hypothetical protein GH714_003656 [Hevea brasiliensis]|uniref:Pentatricopeptide repeat-containing protein n=1 Tax=Hevea brasiliensis TaxID=3981 RepID=A0A6A6MAJ8_HEVBR|nr:hypothetical protein GH714_003656 [Hevea brasiliensis]
MGRSSRFGWQWQLGIPKMSVLERLCLFTLTCCGIIYNQVISFSVALTARVNLKDSRLGRGVHGQVIKSSEEPDQVVNNALLILYAQCGCYSEVLKMFDEMPQRNVVSWNSLIGGFAKRLFNGMSCEDLATWNAMLTGYAINGRMREVTAMLGLQKMG